MQQPIHGLRDGDVERDPACRRHAARRPRDMAGDPDDLMPGLDQAGDNGAPDQPGRPVDQHAHPRLSVFSHGSNAPGCAARNAADATLISLFAAAQVSPCPALGLVLAACDPASSDG